MTTPGAASPTSPGTLIAWGGGGDNELLDWLGDHYAGTDAEIVVAATFIRPLVTGRAYAHALRRRGFAAVNVINPTNSTPADARTHLRRLEKARLVFFTGGDQECLTEKLGGTRFLEVLRDRYLTDGLVVAGTSAGAAALPDHMIVSGHGWRSYHSGRVRTAPGLGLVAGVYFDTHFSERNRIGRLAHAVLLAPQRIGIGLGEETGIRWQPNGRGFEVMGEGVVTVVDGRESTAPGLRDIPPGDTINGHNLRLHLLTAGQQFQW